MNACAAPLSNHIDVASYAVWFELCVVIRQPSWPPTLVLLPPLLQYPSGQLPLVVVSTCGKRIRPKLASSVPTCASAARIAFFMLKTRLVWPFALLLHNGEPSFAWL